MPMPAIDPMVSVAYTLDLIEVVCVCVCERERERERERKRGNKRDRQAEKERQSWPGRCETNLMTGTHEV